MLRGEPTKTHSAIVSTFFGDRCVAVTGAAGTIGRELVSQLLALGVSEVRALDNDENGLFELGALFGSDRRLLPNYCDVSSAASIRSVFDGADYIFHAAALKHVPVCERTPLASVDVNIRGVENVIDAAFAARVKRVIFTSSDKAVHPTNVMGASKLLGERIAIAANRRAGKTTVACTRFGNVAGSRGSVVPVFRDQIFHSGHVTITSTDMTRFFMTRQLAVRMVIESMVHAQGGEIFIPKMRVVAISDLAEVMIRVLAPLAGRAAEDIKIEVVGPRPGEKLYEELLSDEELDSAISVDDYLIVLPQAARELYDPLTYRVLGAVVPVPHAYSSNVLAAMTQHEIEIFLQSNGLLPCVDETPMLRLVAAA